MRAVCEVGVGEGWEDEECDDDDPGDDAGGAGPPNEEVTGQVGEEVREAV